jgi:hypothetical protein
MLKIIRNKNAVITERMLKKIKYSEKNDEKMDKCKKTLAKKVETLLTKEKKNGFSLSQKQK